MECSALFTPQNGASLHNIDLGVFNVAIESSRLVQAIGSSAFNAGLHLGEMFSFIWDTGASYTVTPHLEDFIDGVTALDTPIALDGLATGLTISGKGHINWMVPALDGSLKSIMVEAYYTPGARARLLSPQSYLQQCDRKGWTKPLGAFSDRELSLTWPDGSSILVPYSETNNLPVSLAYNGSTVQRRNAELHLCVTDMANQNLSEAQKELLRWHFRLGHINFASIQLILRSGALATSEGAKALHRAASKCELPKCASCQFGKMKRRPTESTASTPVVSSEGALKKSDLLPGQHVSVDHFICHTRGRLYHSKGKTKKESMYSGGCLFVDHSSGLVHVEHQVAMTSHETLKSKSKFEAIARDSGVIIQSYTSDNGSAFSSVDFNKELAEFKQTVRFAGVGAHHHNGVAERNIQSIMCMARTMMLHAAIRWPETADTSLWPMAVDYAVYVHNHLPRRDTGLSPMDLFSGTKWPTHKCNDLHVWGCPVYVLDSQMQDGKKLPRWTTRSRRAIFVGLSAKHASTAPLVLNIDSQYISPQFHCVFDSWFSTVVSGSDLLPDLDDPVWANLFGTSHFQYYFDDYQIPPLGEEWNDKVESETVASKVRNAQDKANPVVPLAPEPILQPTPISTTDSLFKQSLSGTDQGESAPISRRVSFEVSPPGRKDDITRGSHPDSSLREPTRPLREPASREPVGHPTGTPVSPQTPIPVSSLRTDPQHSTGPTSMEGSSQPVRPHQPRSAPSSTPIRRSNRSNLGTSRPKYHEEFHFLAAMLGDDDCPSTPEDLATFAAYVASSSKDPDTLSYDQAIRDVDAEDWKAAMQKEISALIGQDTWDVVKKSEATGKIIPGTWTLRRKRLPDGTIKSLKARWCVRGDLQEPVGDTFAPVVMWSTIRLLMYFTLFFGLKTRCVDFSNAFVQAPLDDPIFIHLPRGFHSNTEDDVCLRLKKSLYGLTQAPQLWFEHLKGKLLKRGFTQSNLDPCLFYSDSILLVVYVDDIILASRDDTAFDRLIADLQLDSNLTDEGELTAFLGIQVTRDATEKAFTLSQPGLTDRIISALGLEDSNPKWTPTSGDALGSDKNGAPFSENWDYRSLIGMLLYLSNNSRPDIAFAVHQCARFSHAPKQSHAIAVKAIGRYLLRTRTQGLILKPSGDLAIDCYVDADFAGLWTHEDDQDPICVKSRTGYLITIGGCPLTWCSKLQSEIALSTMEAEYIALSQSMRELLPIREIVQEMALGLKFKEAFEIRTYSKIFEDNNGALILASSPRMTPRSKHIAVKYHFFRSHVASGAIRILRINTEEQKADIFTKGLVRAIFEKVRALLMGW